MNQKRNTALIFIIVSVLVAMVIMAADSPPIMTIVNKNHSSYTDSTDHDGTTWQCFDSTVSVVTDSGYVLTEMSGTAIMPPGGKFYIGTTHDGATLKATVASAEYSDSIIAGGFRYGINKLRIPFYFRYLRSVYNSQTDLTDTTYYMVACGGSSQHDRIIVENFNVSQSVLNNGSY